MNWKLSAIGAALVLSCGACWAQGVKYFDKPPSVEELQKALSTDTTAPAAAPAAAPVAGPADAAPAAEGDPAQPAVHRRTRGIGGATGALFGTAGALGAAATVPAATQAVPPPSAAAAPAAAGAVSASAGAPALQAAGGSVAPTAVAAPRPPAIALPVRFDVDSALLSSGSMKFVDSIAQLLLRDPNLRLYVEGHTDAQGDARHNMMLSWERAFSVFRVLVDRYNIDPARLQPIGKGATEPLGGSAPTDPLNRRVQFRVIS